jgi:nucleoside permease NupC
MGVMYHLNVMQAIVRVMAWAITKVMRCPARKPPASAPASSSARPRRR